MTDLCELCSVLSKNRARQHRKLARLLQSFAHLQEEALYLDQKSFGIAEASSQTGAIDSSSTATDMFSAYTLQWTTRFMVRF
eukprot:SAG25_NODE_1086_length_4076_cov_1.856676_6_plen_82_part_00